MPLISLRHGQEVALGEGLESGQEDSLEVQTGVHTSLHGRRNKVSVCRAPRASLSMFGCTEKRSLRILN